MLVGVSAQVITHLILIYKIDLRGIHNHARPSEPLTAHPCACCRDCSGPSVVCFLGSRASY